MMRLFREWAEWFSAPDDWAFFCIMIALCLPAVGLVLWSLIGGYQMKRIKYRKYRVLKLDPPDTLHLMDGVHFLHYLIEYKNGIAGTWWHVTKVHSLDEVDAAIAEDKAKETARRAQKQIIVR